MDSPTHVVTGATDGIGMQTALVLGRQGARVLVHGRSEAKARAACQQLGGQAPGARFEPVWGDLAKLAEVRALAAQVVAAAPVLDVLVNNAGVFLTGRTVTVDGHEATLQVNHLAPFLLTSLLRGALEAAPQGRVVNVSSMAHARGKVVLEDLESARHYEGSAVYGLSKLLNVYFTHALARRLVGTRVTTSALHPGVITTKLLRAGFGMTGASLESGARTSVYCATAPELARVSGRYYSDAREVPCAPHADDPALEETLWERSLAMVTP
jgi:NAD(P)-dependent dehydrogenase (short-subunit alcohol dehydrogenase family)